FVTTPIFYVNANPHLGHLYSATIADALHRFKKIQRPDSETIFSTGTDEHGLKIQQAASNLNKSPRVFCDGYSAKFRDLFNSYDINYTHFIRTTENDHLNAVQHFLGTLISRDYIYKGEYSGWYCVSDESFLTESQVTNKSTPDGVVKVSVESGHRVEWNSETNYKFKLSQLEADLTYWLKDNNRVKPRRFLHDLRNMVGRGLVDLSVSRPRERVTWGAPFPNDDHHTVYVWVDALVNYLTAAGYPKNPSIWPPDVQVLGKDILQFHGVFWPALLIAAGLEPPRQLLVHSHWTVDGVKMSKSLGNVVCPLDMRESMTAEGVRYLLLRQGTPHADGSWRTKESISMLNADLADALGNLVHRCTGKSLNKAQVFPALSNNFLDNSSHVKVLLEILEPLKDEVAHCYEEFHFYQGIDKIMSMVRCANLMVQEEKPWTLKDQPEKLGSVLHLALSAGRAAAIMLLPVVPLYASRLLDTLAVPECERTWDCILDYPCVTRAPRALGKRMAPFKKINV
ncbi:Methionyl-tRNA synthetase, partial [Trinorchestia longiramus]